VAAEQGGVRDSAGDASETLPQVPRLPPAATPFRTIAIVGIGLIGGSLGLALRERSSVERVVGIDRSEEVVARALSLGAIHDGSTDLAAIAGAECVIFATPVEILPDLMERAKSWVASDTVVTDTGSVKRQIVAVGQRLFGPRFVGGHPMAGSADSGIEAARADLFEQAPWALIQCQAAGQVEEMSVSRITSLVTSIGARAIHLPAPLHDHAVALVSHLPHVLAYTFARTVAADPEAESALSLAAGSYRDLTRVSRASPDLWIGIFLQNRELLMPILSAYEASLQSFRAALESADEDALRQLLNSSSPE
jgi:prephenate dehydrogenase